MQASYPDSHSPYILKDGRSGPPAVLRPWCVIIQAYPYSIDRLHCVMLDCDNFYSVIYFNTVIFLLFVCILCGLEHGW